MIPLYGLLARRLVEANFLHFCVGYIPIEKPLPHSGAVRFVNPPLFQRLSGGKGR